MKTKSDIVTNWLPRYTGTPTKDFSKYIILVNFTNYVGLFAQWHDVEVRGLDRPMPNATAHGITILNFGMGSASAATVMDLLQCRPTQSGALPREMRRPEEEKQTRRSHSSHRRDSRRGDIDRLFPARSSRAAGFLAAKGDLNHNPQSRSRLLDRDGLHHQPTGVGTRRSLQEISRPHPCMGIDMETATIFITGFHNGIPTGALLLVSDQPMVPEGVKTAVSDEAVTLKFMDRHLRIGIDSLTELINNGLTVKHLRF
jgi:AMP nucleosidase